MKDHFLVMVALYSSHIITLLKCDMIKGNELDVAIIDFELQAKTGKQILTLYI